MTISKNIVGKIKKLLAMTESPNEHEAFRAATIVQALLLTHNLTIADLPTEGEAEAKEVLIARKLVMWRHTVLVAVAEFYDCLILEHRQNGSVLIRIVGTEANATVALLMANYCEKAIDRLVLESKEKSPPFKPTLEFRRGAAIRIAHKLRRKKAEMMQYGLCTEDRTASALVVRSESERAKAAIKAWILNEFSAPLKGSKPRKKEISSQLQAGYIAGESIGIDAQLTGQKALAPTSA